MVRDPQLGAGQWFHWAVVVQSGRLRLYVNGKSEIYRYSDNDTFDWVYFTASVPTTDVEVLIGQSANGLFATAAGSAIDDLRVSARAVYTGPFDSIYTVGSGAPTKYRADFVPPAAAFLNP